MTLHGSSQNERAIRIGLFLVLSLTVMVPSRAEEDPPKPTKQGKEASLTEADKRYLEDLMKDFLVDPKGCQYVSAKIMLRNVRMQNREGRLDGWLMPAANGKPGRFYFRDGAGIPESSAKDIQKVDFIAKCRSGFDSKPVKSAFKVGEKEFVIDLPSGFDVPLAEAAWLYRVGEEGLAARALAKSRESKEDPREILRKGLAADAFADMVHAYMVRDDEEALAHGEALLRLSGKSIQEEHKQVGQIVEDLKRRQKQGTFGKTPPKSWPTDFEKWESKKKVKYLIDSLDEVDARQWGQPGGVELASDRRVKQLIAMGDAVVPDLIDVLEGDRRLTRSVHYWRDFASSRTVVSVREAALTALMSTMRVQAFEVFATGDNFTSHGEQQAIDTARKLREYWKEYGKLPFDERMMRILTNPKSDSKAKREAAENLSRLPESRDLQTTIDFEVQVIGGPPPKPNPAVAKFSKPTIAEAILAAMDEDLKPKGPAKQDDNGMEAFERNRIESTYLRSLIQLRDGRIASELAKRADAAKSIKSRHALADAAIRLGAPGPMQTLAKEFGEGKLDFKGTYEDQGEVCLLVRTLIELKIPDGERALESLVDPKHPQHGEVLEDVLGDNARGQFRWAGLAFDHPICLRFLRQALDDRLATGETCSIKDGTLTRGTERAKQWGPLPELIADPNVRSDSASVRVCDIAAEKLSEVLVGVHPYHPLLKDADKQLTALKSFYDRFGGNFRRLGWAEEQVLKLDYESQLKRGRRPSSFSNPHYVPALRPLGRVATAEDVKSGKAIFYLDGKGRPSNLKLPACAVRKGGDKDGQQGVLIMQAETGPDGKTILGVIEPAGIKSISDSEVKDIKSYEQLQKEQEEMYKQRMQK
jgi:hypothetical protein